MHDPHFQIQSMLSFPRPFDISCAIYFDSGKIAAGDENGRW